MKMIALSNPAGLGVFHVSGYMWYQPKFGLRQADHLAQMSFCLFYRLGKTLKVGLD